LNRIEEPDTKIKKKNGKDQNRLFSPFFGVGGAGWQCHFFVLRQGVANLGG
jgi:hypothetical protein